MKKRSASKHVKKKKVSGGVRMMKVFCCIAIVYFSMQMGKTVFNGVETVAATRVTVDQSITASGYFLRNETVVEGTTSETVQHVVHNGEKVQTGTQLAVEYSNASALANSRALSALQDKITLLQTVLNASAVTEDTGKLDQLIAIQMQNVTAQLKNGDLSGLSEASSEMRQLILRRGAGVQDAEALQTELLSLQEQQASLLHTAASLSNTIVSPCDGYFCDTVDGYETVFTITDIDGTSTEKALTVETLAQKAATNVQSDSKALGRIMQGFYWYYAAALPAEDASAMKKGQSVNLRFPQISEDIPASVYAVRPDTSQQKTLVILKSNYIRSELLSMREQTADIILGTYTGIKIPKSAIHMLNGQLGVYTLNGNVSNFKPIETLYEGDRYYVVKQTNIDNDGIVLQDNIIIHARGLGDKKVVIK